MKLIIQIPCKNEEDTLRTTIDDLPKKIKGVKKIETLVVDDGSTDGTLKKALSLKVDHVLKYDTNRGLARTFVSALRFSRTLGADAIVHTDADNQYPGKYIPDLVEKLITSDAGLVVGDRNTKYIPHFSFVKKILQKWGSYMVGVLAGYPIPDAPSGFRAYTPQTAAKLTVHSRYTYTLETLIQARMKGIKVEFIDITTNPSLRESRLMKSMFNYLFKSFQSLVVIVLLYEPLVVGVLLSILSALVFAGGVAAYFFLPALFSVLIVSSAVVFLGGWFFTFLAKISIATRMHMEEQFAYIDPDLSPVECARRLGASEYWRNGKRLFPA